MENFCSTLKHCKNRESLAQQIFPAYSISFTQKWVTTLLEFSNKT